MNNITTLNCPGCGGPVDADATSCKYCGALLATISCPHCFGVAFRGSQFCPHCGGALAEAASDGVSILACPRCKEQMNQRMLNGATLTECDKCGGLWLDQAAFERICSDKESQTSMFGGTFAPKAPTNREANLRYLSCPRCQKLMNRLNFAHSSGVVIDVCAFHGIWFDRDELRRIIQFILAGGVARACDKRKGELEELIRRADFKQSPDDLSPMSRYSDQAIYDACRFAGGLLRDLMK